MNVLVLNCGSSSVKFQLIETSLEQIAAHTDRRLARGNIERIGGEALVSLEATGHEAERTTAALRDTRTAVDLIVRWASSDESQLDQIKSVADIHAVGHRVVHDGEHFTQSLIIDDGMPPRSCR